MDDTTSAMPSRVWMCVGQAGPTDATTPCTWQAMEVTVAEPFDVSSLDMARLGCAFGAGFTVMGIGLLMAFGLRLIIRFVHENA